MCSHKNVTFVEFIFSQSHTQELNYIDGMRSAIAKVGSFTRLTA